MGDINIDEMREREVEGGGGRKKEQKRERNRNGYDTHKDVSELQFLCHSLITD